MRVCHFIGTHLAGQYFVNLAKEMPAHGIQLVFVSLSREEKPAWLKEYQNVKFFNLGVKSRLDYPLAIFRLARILQKESIEILQTHSFDGGYVGILAAKLAKVPKIIITRHHSDLIHRIGMNYHIALDRWMARKADKVIAVSHAARKFMIEHDHINADKIEAIHLGFDFKRLSPGECESQGISEEFDLNGKFVIGCVASFQKIKGIHYLLDALSKLTADIPNIRLLLVGSGDRTEINQQINELNLGAYVVFAGYRQDVPACIKAMDIVVHPSLSEAFCQVLIETMGVGTALIATDVGGAQEVIIDGENGILIPPQDAQAIIEGVLKLYRNPALRECLATEGQKSVRRRFTVERMLAEQLECYARLLGEKSFAG